MVYLHILTVYLYKLNTNRSYPNYLFILKTSSRFDSSKSLPQNLLVEQAQFSVKHLPWLDLAVLMLALSIMLFGIGDYGLYEPHEGHFAMVGNEMVLQGDWITPHLNGAPYLNKPPLLYWLIAISTQIFGVNEFAARLPIALVGWLGIVVTWKWTRQLWGINASRLAALMLSVTVGWFLFTHQILIDVLLGTLMLASNYCLWRTLYYPRSWFYWLAAYLSLSMCLLTKGLIGIVFPLFGCLVLALIRQDKKVIRRIGLYKGLLLVLALVVPWFIAVEQANPGFWHYFIVNEHLDRLLDRRFPPDYEVSKITAGGYLGITALWCFPWILFLPSVIKFSWQQWRKGFKDNAPILDRQRSDGIMLLAIAAILPIICFLPVSSRLIYYSIPAIAPYIILCAGWFSKWQSSEVRPRVDERRKGTRTSRRVNNQAVKINSNIYGIVAVCLGVGFASVILFLPLFIELLPAVINTLEIRLLIVIVLLVLGLGWIASGIGLLRQSRGAWLPIFLALIITYIAIVRGFIAYQELRSSKTLIRTVETCLATDTLWTFEGSRELGAAGAIGYYLNRDRDFKTANDLVPGWTRGKSGNIYRQVMVLSDGGKNRLPPRFPGSPPSYLINQQQLQKYWFSDRPVVFMTDFLRQPGDKHDPPTLNLPPGATKPALIIGDRQLYLNAAAQKLGCDFGRLALPRQVAQSP